MKLKLCFVVLCWHFSNKKLIIAYPNEQERFGRATLGKRNE